ncbi:zinc-ribbon domain-containing protein [Lysinibacillus sp. NPDC086135]|uniref:zinc-ribbon domain-containing protein n=1 Tax=Lysinibacillus sp. NPDC086135 TaxID=3364130 RepID=UPI003825AE92
MCNTYVRPEFDTTIELKDNAMLKVRPELFDEWDFEKNDKLGLEVYKATKGSNKKAWWVCRDNKEHKWDAMINSRTKGTGCSYCRGLKVNNTNSLTSLNPELAKEWHPTKNGDLTPHDVTCGSHTRVWWKCRTHENHEWEATINSRTNMNTSCPYCSGQKVLKGFNDMWTTNPELAKLLLIPEDGYKYMQNSGQKVDWKCPDCDEIIKNKTISMIMKNGLSCHKCSDGVSYPEKVMYCLLKNLNVKFKYEKTFTWSQAKRYDFYISSHDMIIEMHGIQHYVQTNRKRARSLQEEQENDRLKEQLAKDNGIDHYIVIDARYSEFEYIRNSIKNSKLNDMLDLNKVNWEEIHKNLIKSLIIQVCDEWNKGVKNISNLCEKFSLSRGTINNYLKKGAKANICEYSKDISIRTRNKINATKRNKSVVQISLNSTYITSWSSVSEAFNHLGKETGSSISACCKGKLKSAYGFKWMYKEDYEKYIEDQKQLA